MLKQIKRRELYLKYKNLTEKGFKFKRCNDWRKILKYKNKKNRKFIKLQKNKKNKTIVDTSIHKPFIKLGSVIDFEKNINNLQKMNTDFIAASKIHKSAIRINLSQLKEISINGLMYFLSHVDMLNNSRLCDKFIVEKGFKYNNRYGINPTNEKLKYLFLKIGFWDYFSIRKPYSINSGTENEYFLKIQTDTEAKTKYVAELRNFMINIVPFIKDEVIQEYFEDALTEVMANSVEHAYIENLPYREKGKWWLCGHYNKINNCLEFSFRDYGVGLRKTLEYNTSEVIRSFIREVGYKFQDDSEIIRLLVNDQIPKYKNKKDKIRGYGFKKFKEFANNIGYNCEMKIMSGKGKYKYTYNTNTKESKEDLGKLEFDLGGFLINWKIYINNGEMI